MILSILDLPPMAAVLLLVTLSPLLVPFDLKGMAVKLTPDKIPSASRVDRLYAMTSKGSTVLQERRVESRRP